MNSFALIFVVVNACALLTLRRKWAPVPMLVSCCYMTIGQGVQLGPVSLPIYRMILAIGVMRVLVRGERWSGGFNTIDKLLVAWAVWVFTASLFHEWAPGSGPLYASGFIYNIALSYVLIRIWCRDLGELIAIVRILAFVLVPVALEMLLSEHTTGKNLFSVFGGVEEYVFSRGGAFRAQGPFQHPILAGTVGAVCFPLVVGIWRRYRTASVIGSCACVVMIVASASSGPIMSAIFGVFAMVMWRWRQWVKTVNYAAVGVYVMLELVMSRPAYYLISKIDITGTSTGWHRSRLMEVAIDNFAEWWLFGTDLTIHWMGQSIGWSDKHSDITNYYIWIGVIGGFPAIVLLVAMMWMAFRWVGQAVRTIPPEMADDRLMIWCLGAGLFAHATTSFSVAYFDQSAVFFWLNVAVISSMHSTLAIAARAAEPSRSLIPQPSAEVRRVPRWRREMNDPWPGRGSSSTAPVQPKLWSGGRT
jgi:hypothetical protein